MPCSQYISALQFYPVKDFNGVCSIMAVTRREKERGRVTRTADYVMDFSIQPATCTTCGLIFRPFLPPLAL